MNFGDAHAFIGLAAVCEGRQIGVLDRDLVHISRRISLKLLRFCPMVEFIVRVNLLAKEPQDQNSYLSPRLLSKHAGR